MRLWPVGRNAQCNTVDALNIASKGTRTPSTLLSITMVLWLSMLLLGLLAMVCFYVSGQGHPPE